MCAKLLAGGLCVNAGLGGRGSVGACDCRDTPCCVRFNALTPCSDALLTSLALCLTLSRITMNRTAFALRCLALCLALAFPLTLAAATDEALPTLAGRSEETNSLEILRSNAQLQAELYAAQLNLEHWAALARRLDTIEETQRAQKDALGTERSRDFEAQQKSNTIMLIVAGSFATVGFAALVLMAYFLWRTIQRLAELSAALPAARPFNPRPALPALGSGESGLINIEPAEQTNQRLLGAIDRLERRIGELEHTAQAPLKDAEHRGGGFAIRGAAGNGNAVTPPANGEAAGSGEAAGEEATAASQLMLLLGKGQSFIHLDDPEAALECFEKALALEPHHPEALIKKGAALERLRRLEEALECYNQALAADGSVTIAYLYKAGLCNRLERPREALECYEKALRAQEQQRL